MHNCSRLGSLFPALPCLKHQPGLLLHLLYVICHALTALTMLTLFTFEPGTLRCKPWLLLNIKGFRNVH